MMTATLKAIPSWLAAAPAAPDPWVPRPLGVLAILDHGVAVLRAEFRVLGPVLGAAILPVGVLSALAARQASGGSGGNAFAASFTSLGGHGPWVVVGAVVTLCWPAVVAGPACRVAAASWYGRRIDRRTAARGLMGLPSFLLALLLVDLLIAVGFVVLVVPALAVWVALHLTVPVMVVEGRNPWSALRRSAQLVGRRAGGALLLFGATGLVGLALEAALSLLPDALAQALGLRFGFVVVAIGFSAVRLVTWTWAMIVQATFALDLQARSEALDLLARASSWPAAAPVPEHADGERSRAGR